MKPLMTRSLRTRSVNPTRKPLPRSVTKSSNGLMLTNWLRLMSLQTSKRKWKAFAIQSSLSYTNKLEEHQEVCPVVCQEVCLEACPVMPGGAGGAPGAGGAGGPTIEEVD